MTFRFLGIDLTVTTIGVALCEPADPYAPPVATHVPPFNIYGCQNLAAFEADVATDETSADILITIDHIFLDLETIRDKNIPCGEFSGGIVTADGYLLGDASVAVGVSLSVVDGCVHASLVPDSVAFTLTHHVVASQDACLENNMGTIPPILFPLVQDNLNVVFEAALVVMMGQIDSALCNATPNENATWGHLKSGYR